VRYNPSHDVGFLMEAQLSINESTPGTYCDWGNDLWKDAIDDSRIVELSMPIQYNS
jgi:hypothetical protein